MHIGSTRIYAETSITMLRRKFDQVTNANGQALLQDVTQQHGETVAAFAADLLSGDRRGLIKATDA